jgi:hypothetical protein
VPGIAKSTNFAVDRARGEGPGSARASVGEEPAMARSCGRLAIVTRLAARYAIDGERESGAGGARMRVNGIPRDTIRLPRESR